MGQITLTNVRKAFGDTVVIPDLDLTIEDGEFCVFVGPSGCGKSTLLRLIAGLEDTTSGTIAIDGVDVTDNPPAKRGLAMVFQSYALYPHMSVAKNIAFPLKMAKMDKAEQDKRVKSAAATLDLTPYLDRKPGQLSGGQRQRVAIGRAIVREPEAFLFDEPLSNLDAALRVGMRTELTELHDVLATTMVYVTHDQIEAMTLADKIVVLRAGIVEQVGTPLELYHHPSNLFVAGFIGSPKMNFLPAEVASVDAGGVTVRTSNALGAAELITLPVRGEGVSAGDAVTLGVRPEHVVSAGADAQLSGEVFVTERLGGATYLHVRMADGADMIVQAPGDSRARVHERVGISFDPSHCHLFDASGRAIAHIERNPLAELRASA